MVIKMFDYIKGKIVEVAIDHIVVENQNIGYILVVPNPSDFNYGVEKKFIHISMLEKMDYLYLVLSKEKKKNYFLN